jgi:hypothetical protein
MRILVGKCEIFGAHYFQGWHLRRSWQSTRGDGLETTQVRTPNPQFLRFGGLLLLIHSGFLQIAKSMTELLKKGVKFVWSEACEKAFHTLR